MANSQSLDEPTPAGRHTRQKRAPQPVRWTFLRLAPRWLWGALGTSAACSVAICLLMGTRAGSETVDILFGDDMSAEAPEVIAPSQFAPSKPAPVSAEQTVPIITDDSSVETTLRSLQESLQYLKQGDIGPNTATGPRSRPSPKRTTTGVIEFGRSEREFARSDERSTTTDPSDDFIQISDAAGGAFGDNGWRPRFRKPSKAGEDLTWIEEQGSPDEPNRLEFPEPADSTAPTPALDTADPSEGVVFIGDLDTQSTSGSPAADVTAEAEKPKASKDSRKDSNQREQVSAFRSGRASRLLVRGGDKSDTPNDKPATDRITRRLPKLFGQFVTTQASAARTSPQAAQRTPASNPASESGPGAATVASARGPQIYNPSPAAIARAAAREEQSVLNRPTRAAGETNNRPEAGRWYLQPFYVSQGPSPAASAGAHASPSDGPTADGGQPNRPASPLMRQVFGIGVNGSQGLAANKPQDDDLRLTDDTIGQALVSSDEFWSGVEFASFPLEEEGESSARMLSGRSGPTSGEGGSHPSDNNSLVAQLFMKHRAAPIAGSIVAGAKPPIDSEVSAWGTTWTIQVPSLAHTFHQTVTTKSSPGLNGAIAAAYLQEPLPTPGSASDGSQQTPDSIRDAETLGEEPVDNSLQFLRTATVLLEPGKMQFDYGLTYSISENDFPILVTDGMTTDVDEAFFRSREMIVPLELRMGLLKRLQGFVSVPVGWANTEATYTGHDAFANDGGLGDISAGLTIQLQEATVDSPDVVTTIAFTAPTGQEPFTPTGLALSSPTLGDGFWGVSANLLCIRTWDPIVVFYGAGVLEQIERNLFGADVRPGTQFNYSLGVGFAVNENVTLSTRFAGAYVEELELDGERVAGTIQEPMSIRVAATISRKKYLVEPFVEFGTTDDAVSSFFGIVWTQ